MRELELPPLPHHMRAASRGCPAQAACVRDMLGCLRKRLLSPRKGSGAKHVQ